MKQHRRNMLRRRNRVKRRISTSKHKTRSLIDILGLDKNREDFVAKEGYNIRISSKSDGDFLKNLLENKNLNDVEKMLIAYKIGYVDGQDSATGILEMITKQHISDKEQDNRHMYS